MTLSPIRNALTVDVEDYFQVSAFASHIAREAWDGLPCRIERNIEAILALFNEHNAHATFFTLGWIADRYPGLVRRSSSRDTSWRVTATATSARPTRPAAILR
jgi:peptidoglycan/xylan/chitin deacetylase (PgdA/CDA1 family)